MSGKGSRRRPTAVSRQTFVSNWEMTFGKQKNVPEKPLYPCQQCGNPRTEEEGGKIFTVCDDCWDSETSLGQKLNYESYRFKAFKAAMETATKERLDKALIELG